MTNAEQLDLEFQKKLVLHWQARAATAEQSLRLEKEESAALRRALEEQSEDVYATVYARSDAILDGPTDGEKAASATAERDDHETDILLQSSRLDEPKP